MSRRTVPPTATPLRRILITGSRAWTDTATVREALAQVWHPDAVLVSGACPRGADALCEAVWSAAGGRVERHPAEWSRGRGAGYARNAAMVDLGADICLAFIVDGSAGASYTADRAETAGIPTRRYAQART
jgi:hypothetical protein